MAFPTRTVPLLEPGGDKVDPSHELGVRLSPHHRVEMEHGLTVRRVVPVTRVVPNVPRIFSFCQI